MSVPLIVLEDVGPQDQEGNKRNLKKFYSSDAGMPLYSAEFGPIVIEPGERHIFSTGLRLAIPVNYELQIRPRSGLTSRGIDVGLGTIDASYRGFIKVCLINNTKQPMAISFGDQIAQAILGPVLGNTVYSPRPSDADEFVTTIGKIHGVTFDNSRGDAGFGSTDKK